MTDQHAELLTAAVDGLARVARILERAAAPLSLADYRALSAIVAGEVRASRMAERLAVGKPAISATVDSLARRGLVARDRTADDQRVIALTITAEGRAVFEAAQASMAERIERIVNATDAPAAGIRTLAGLDAAIELLRTEQVAL